MPKLVCPICQTPVREGVKNCPECGATVGERGPERGKREPPKVKPKGAVDDFQIFERREARRAGREAAAPVEATPGAAPEAATPPAEEVPPFPALVSAETPPLPEPALEPEPEAEPEPEPEPELETAPEILSAAQFPPEPIAPKEAPPMESEVARKVTVQEPFLRKFIVQNLGLLEAGLKLYTSEDGKQAGEEYPTAAGKIDVLATDKAGNYVLVLLQKTDAPDTLVAQTLRHVTWVKKNVEPGGKGVRAILVVAEATASLRDAIEAVADLVGLKEYEVRLAFRDVA